MIPVQNSDKQKAFLEIEGKGVLSSFLGVVFFFSTLWCLLFEDFQFLFYIELTRAKPEILLF